MKITHIVTVVSACKTYRETIKCVSENEANQYAEAVRAEGGTAIIKEVKNV